jgi:alkylhydroperoxidase family enzyme
MILAVAVLNEAEYEWYQHEPVYLGAGGTPEQAAALRHLGDHDEWKNASTLFGDVEQDALVYAVAITRSGKPPTEVQLRLKSALGERELVELTMTICAYNCCSRFLLACDINPPDDED